MRSVRWLAGGISALLLTAVVAWVLLVPAADWLAHHDVGSVTGSLQETALDNARDRLLTLGAGLFAAGALVFTARNFTLSREGQVTDRYSKAIEQLGSDKLDVRIGGIYALERIARDSKRDHPTVMEVLTAFIRDHSHEQWPPPDPSRMAWITWRGRSRAGGREQAQSSPRPDIQAAVTVVGRRNAKRDIDNIALAGARLRDADLAGARLRGADLAGADLTGAILTRADLTGADLASAHLDGVNLDYAHLRDAFFEGATLTGAHLWGADLTRAYLASNTQSGGDLPAADLTGADLMLADLTDAVFEGATLTDAQLVGAKWSADIRPRKAGNRIDMVTCTGRRPAPSQLERTRPEALPDVTSLRKPGRSAPAVSAPGCPSFVTAAVPN